MFYDDWDFDNEAYENYEASEILGDEIEAIKERLLSKIKADIKAKYESIETENQSLREQNKKYQNEKIELNKKVIEFEQNIKAFEKEKLNYSLQDLAKKNFAEVYSVKYNQTFEDIPYKTPSGREFVEKIETAREYFVEVNKVIGLYAQAPKGSASSRRYLYFKYNESDRDYCNLMSIEDKLLYSLEEAKEKGIYNYFVDIDVAKEYADYLNNEYKNKLNAKVE